MVRSLAFGLLCLAAAPAVAQTPQETAALRQACTGDYMRFCAAFDPNSPQVEACFNSKMAELSPQCRTAIGNYSKANPEGRKR